MNANKNAFTLAGLWLLAIVIFRFAPQVDMAVSDWFYSAKTGFEGGKTPIWQQIRFRIWDLALVVAGAIILGSAFTLILRRSLLGMPALVWSKLLALFLLGPGLIVDGILKRYSGRARPAQITDYGGELDFSVATVWADQCAKNCSFVSGEVAGAVALSLALLTVLRFNGHHLSPMLLRALMTVSVALPVLTSAQRIVSGRHFLSDAVFATLIVLTLAWALRLWRKPVAT